MARHYKKILFDEAYLKQQPLNKKQFIDILDQLPNDINVVGFFQFEHELTCGFIVESKSFDDVSLGETIPELIIKPSTLTRYTANHYIRKLLGRR